MAKDTLVYLSAFKIYILNSIYYVPLFCYLLALHHSVSNISWAQMMFLKFTQSFVKFF